MHPDDAEWDAWTPAEAAVRLQDVDAPWYVAAGWAIDLFLGEHRREHEDLEIGVPESAFGEVADALGELDFHVVTAGIAEPVAGAGELMRDVHQTWGLDRAANVWRIDVFREPSAGGRLGRAARPSITLPYDALIEHTDDGIPYARPEVVLLFKAKAARPKDEADLAAVLPRPAGRRALLAEWIDRVHPGHFWLPDLARPERLESDSALPNQVRRTLRRCRIRFGSHGFQRDVHRRVGLTRLLDVLDRRSRCPRSRSAGRRAAGG